MDPINIPNKIDTLYVEFFAEVSPLTVEQLTAVMTQVVRKKIPNVYLAMSSPGGDVASGVALYNTLRGMPFTLTTHNMGSVNSIGTVVFLAGEQRYTVSNSDFLFHGVANDTTQLSRIDEGLAKDYVQSISRDNDRLAGIVANRTNLSHTDATKLYTQQSILDANSAKTIGLVTDIRDLHFPSGATIHTLVPQR